MRTSTDDAAVARLVAHGAAAHPGLAEPAALRELLAASIARGTADLEARAADLYLAAACVAGVPAAIAELDARLPGMIRPALVRLGIAAADHDEILQRVRIVLLVRDGSGTRGLAAYTGRGELRAYVRSVAVRIALRRIEREAPPASQDHHEILTWLPDARDSPEILLLKRHCRGHLRLAFASAMAALTARERTLLRQHYLDGLTVDRLGPLHSVHRSTCARWIEAARVKILRAIRNYMRASLMLDNRDLDAAVALVSSQLELSLARHLISTDAST